MTETALDLPYLSFVSRVLTTLHAGNYWVLKGKNKYSNGVTAPARPHPTANHAPTSRNSLHNVDWHKLDRCMVHTYVDMWLLMLEIHVYITFTFR